jgi:hypothetical protein
MIDEIKANVIEKKIAARSISSELGISLNSLEKYMKLEQTDFCIYLLILEYVRHHA